MKMTQLRKYVVFLSLAVFMLLVNICASAQVSVLTQHNNNQRTGANLNETTLNTSNVNGNQFGLLFKLAVDDQVWASPLYVAALSIGGVTHNVVYVATANNSVFAFDADRGGTALWSRNFNNGGRPTDHTEVGTGGFCNPYVDMVGHIGIVGTPVIDSSTNTMYFVARTVEGGGTVQRLHAIDITTGNDRAQVVIQANGFDPVVHNQRPALTLSQGVVYIAWSSYCDFGGYHGFVMGYDASTLQQVHVFNDTPGGSQGGIWQAGQGASVDSNGDLYWETGNGSSNPNAAQFSESFIKLNPSNGLSVQDWFMPSDFASLNNGDRDLGSSGPLLIPGTSRILGGGKDGIFFLLDTNNMGHLVNNDTQIVQKFQATFVHNGCATLHIHGSPVYWNSNSSGPLIYVWGENDFLREFQFNGSTLNTSAIHTSTMTAATCGMPGCQLSVSANGGATGSGVLWANCVLSGDANHATQPGIFRAFNADDVSQELWDSQQNAGRDSCNNYSKYSYPVIANGKVYLSSFGTAARDSGQVCVYGDFPTAVHVNAVNAGGPAVGSFAADVDFIGGSTSTSTAAVDTSGVTNPAPMAVYQSRRFGNFTYTLPGFTAGSSHTVRLHFSENFFTAAGQRVFNVSINGTQVLTNFDIFAAAGAQNKAVIREFVINANSSGQYGIQFTSVVNNASVSGIEIVSASTSGPVDINSGGPGVGAFVADTDFSGGVTINHANTIDLSGVTNPAPMAVYQTARVAATVGAGTSFTYTIPGFVPGSSQLVRLHFAETFHTGTGQRVFNVSVNGTQVLANFDIFAAAGNAANKAVIREFTANADANGNYVIVFTTVTDKALVSGIEVDAGSTTCTLPSTPTGLTATAISTSQINLSWGASSSS